MSCGGILDQPPATLRSESPRADMGGGASRTAPDDGEPSSWWGSSKKSRRRSSTPQPVGEELHSGNAASRQALMKAAFNQIDADGDGHITRGEIKMAFERMDIEVSDNEMIQLFDRVDVDRSNEISLAEFSMVTALKLHLLAQGLAEAKKEPKPKIRRKSMSEIWKSVVVHLGCSDSGERKVVTAGSLIAMLSKPSRRSSTDPDHCSSRRSSRASQGDITLWSTRWSSLGSLRRRSLGEEKLPGGAPSEEFPRRTSLG